MAAIRLFIAIDTPAGVKEAMRATCDRLRESGADIRWEDPRKLHLTLKFLGETDETMLAAIGDAVSRLAAQTPPLAVRYRGLGCFPPRQDPRVIWVGMEESSGALADLQERLEREMETLGFRREERRFHPHITIGRVRSQRNVRGLLRVLESSTFESPAVALDALHVVRSDLRPAGSVYTILQSYPFTAIPALNE